MERKKGNSLVKVVLTGSPASGKTQVCRQYATALFESRMKKNSNGLYLPILFWKAGSATELANSLRDSLRNIRNPAYLKRINPDLTVMHTTEQVSQHHLARLLKEVLDALKDKYNRRPACEEKEEWLIVIDGASSYGEVKRLMSSLFDDNSAQWGPGKLLVAVQERLSGRHQSTKEIPLQPGMSPAESLDFLTHSFPHDRKEDLQNVAEQLAYIPLSLAVAAETMKLLRKDDASYSWQRHLEKNILPSTDVDTSDHMHPKNLACQYDRTLYQALNQAVKRIGHEGNNAQLFFFLGLCEEGTVPVKLIKKLAVAQLADEPEEGRDDALFVQFKEDIHHNSLILLDGDAGISVHHILHAVLRDNACARLTTKPTPENEQLFVTKHTVSAVIKALCALYQATSEQQSQTSYVDSLQDKLQLLPHFVSVFSTCVQSCGFQDDTVPRFALYAAQLLQLRREGSEVMEALRTGVKSMEGSSSSAGIDLYSSYAKELVEVNDFSSAIELLHKTIKDRKKQDVELQVAMTGKHKTAPFELDQHRKNFVGLHGDLIALGYAFKDRGEEGDLIIAKNHVDEVFELLRRGRTDMADDSSVDFSQMHSEALLLKAQLYQDLARYDPSLLDELLRVSGEGAPASHHNCQVLRTLTDLLLDGPQRDVSKASHLIDRAIDMGHQLYGELHPMIMYSMMTKGRVLLELGRYGESLTVLTKALDMNDRLPKEVRGNTIVPLVHFFKGACYIQQCRYEEAYDVLQVSAERTKMPKVGFGPGHPQNMFVWDKLGLVCIHLGRPKEAKHYLEQSLKLKMRIRGNSHHELRWNYGLLETVAYECDEDDDALIFRAKKLKLSP